MHFVNLLMYRYIQISTVYLYHKTSYDNATYYIGFAPLFTQGLKHGLIKYPAQAGLRAFSHFSLFPLSGLHGSQTFFCCFGRIKELCTFIYLQGSQTRQLFRWMPPLALHLYLLTRFSNKSCRSLSYYWLYTFIYLQGSQTALNT